MNHSVYDLTLDLQEGHSPQMVTVKRGDSLRSLRLHLADGGRPYALTSGCRAVFTAIKPDGSHIFNACTPEGDTLLYQLTPQTTALAGEVECQLRLYGPQEQLLTTAAFLLLVEDTVYADGDETVASTGEATALTKLVSQATEKITEMEAVLKNEAGHAVIDDSAVGTDAWSSKNIVDKLCPAFTQSGAMVFCEPVEGYPLEIVSILPPKADGSNWESLTLTQCGKNLFDFKQTVAEVNLTNEGGGITTRYGHTIRLPAGTYTLHVENAQSTARFIYGAVNGADGSFKSAFSLVIEASIRKQTVTIEDGDVLYLYNGVIGSSVTGTTFVFNQFDIQLEVGSVATAYEPFRGQTITADISKRPVSEGSYNWTRGVLINDSGNMWQHYPQTDTFTQDDDAGGLVVRKIPALAEVNTLYGDGCQITVTGRRDIITILKDL